MYRYIIVCRVTVCACIIARRGQSRVQQRWLNVQVKMLTGLKQDTEEDAAFYKTLVQELTKEYPSHLPLLTAILAGIASLPAEKRKARLQVNSLVDTLQTFATLPASAAMCVLRESLPGQTSVTRMLLRPLGRCLQMQLFGAGHCQGRRRCDCGSGPDGSGKACGPEDSRGGPGC